VAICFGGWLLSKKGILNRSVQKSLSAVNLNLFTPCLIFSKLASSLNLSVLADLWAMPLLFAVVCGVSWLVGFGSARCWGVGRRWEKFVISCSMFQNVRLLGLWVWQLRVRWVER
jgi:predicted permease